MLAPCIVATALSVLLPLIVIVVAVVVLAMPGWQLRLVRLAVARMVFGIVTRRQMLASRIFAVALPVLTMAVLAAIAAVSVVMLVAASVGAFWRRGYLVA